MAKKTITKSKVKKAAKEYSKLSTGWKIFIAVLLIAIVIGAGAYYYFAIYKKKSAPTSALGQFSVHFLELGNNYTGDCIYIKAGDTDILVDGGSRTNSVSTIQTYVNQYVKDGKLEYAIITHADQDHIACWAGDNTNSSLFDLYDIDTIIDFPKSDKTSQVYNRYVLKRDAKADAGSKHYTALDCYNNTGNAKREYTLADGITLQILYNYYYENSSSDENNYSVCFMINQGTNHYLFTGDLEKDGEAKLVEHNTLPKVTLFKAGHHGSGTSSTDKLLSIIQPEYIAITCVAGSVEYTKDKDNTFPYQAVVDRIAKYTDNVFVTSCMDMEDTGETLSNGNPKYKNPDGAKARALNGTIIFECNDNIVTFKGTNNSTKLKDSDWFKTYRTTPTQWA